MRMIIEHIPPSSYKPKITVEYLPIPQLDDRFSPLAATGGKRWKRARQIKRARRMVSTIDDVVDQLMMFARQRERVTIVEPA